MSSMEMRQVSPRADGTSDHETAAGGSRVSWLDIEPTLANQRSLSLVEEIDHSVLPSVAELVYREKVYHRLLVGADAAAAVTAVLLLAGMTGVRLTWGACIVPVFAIVVAKVQGLHDRDDMVIRKSTAAEWRGLIESATITSIGVYLVWRWVSTASAGPGMRSFLTLTLGTFFVSLIGRTAARRIARRLTPDERCLIVGEIEACEDLAETISSLDGVELVGGVTGRHLGRSLADVRHLVTRLHVHRIVIAPQAQSSDAATLELIRNAKWSGVRVSLLPSVMAAVGGCAAFDEIDGHVLLGVPRFGLSRSSGAVKRTFDVIGAATVLCLMSPVLLAVALWIKVDSPGSVLFHQARVGRRGLPFQMIKFRSMVDGADAMKPNLLGQNEASDGLFKIADDPRVTKVGRLIRVSHLDEMPQLWNVLRGEMSLVGPRPLVAEEDEQIAGVDRARLHLTPGITGPWQVRGPMTTPLSEMVKLDYLYISNWSLWQDIDILVRTATRVISRGGH